LGVWPCFGFLRFACVLFVWSPPLGFLVVPPVFFLLGFFFLAAGSLHIDFRPGYIFCDGLPPRGLPLAFLVPRCGSTAPVCAEEPTRFLRSIISAWLVFSFPRIRLFFPAGFLSAAEVGLISSGCVWAFPPPPFLCL